MSKQIIFVLLIVLEIISLLVSNYILLSENLYFNTFAEQLTYEQIELLINQGKKWEWVSYAILPILTLIKLTLVASCLSIGLYFVTNRFSFKAAFGVALEAEFVFLIPALLKIVWFAIFQTDYSLQDLQFFYPLSALNFFEYSTVQPWLMYPLQLFNVFEIIYWVVLARGVSQIIERDISQSFGIVAASYGTGLLLWVAVVMFITVSFTP
jgi:hypothetical protein